MVPKTYQRRVNKTSHWLNRKSSTYKHIRIIKKYLKIKNPKVLDVGCAEGENTKIFKESNFNVAGVDYDKKLLALARKKYFQIKFEFGNVEKLRFESDRFDLVYCINTLFYTDLSKSILEILRVTKRCGLIFITLDISIKDLDKNKIIHREGLRNFKKILNKKIDILYIKKRQRTDYSPFKHKHVFYELLLKKL
jgi:ubiquinone/menaquinone biosynthesis C-methylase UbiE